MDGLTSYELQDGIATITMDDGKVNALSIEMLTALHADLDRAAEDGAVVVLTGREGRFSGGFDLAGFSNGIEPLVEMLRLGGTLCERILSFPRPVVIACNGHAIAAGGFVLLAADARIGVEGAFRIGLNEVQIGLTVPKFVVELARYRLAPPQFDRCLGTAEMLSPDEAVAAGFLDRTVAAGHLAAEAREEAERLRELKGDAHVGTKLRARGPALVAINEAIAAELTVEALSGGG